MIHAHSLGRAAHYYGERTALALGAARPTFRELHDRVAALLRPSAHTGFELAIDWPCSCRTNLTISSWSMRVLGWE